MAGKEDNLGEALALYQKAAELDPRSEFGKKAANKIPIIREALETVPQTVSLTWCTRLRERLQNRLYAQAKERNPEAGDAYLRSVLNDFLANLEHSCRRDAGKPTAPKWVCYWGANYDAYEKCQ